MDTAGASDGPVTDRRVAPDVLENGPSTSLRLSDEWRRTPPRRRRAVSFSIGVLTAVLALGVLAIQGRGWLVERGLRDQVSLVATVRVSAASMTPRGGSVNYIVAVRNTGPRAVQITGVDVSASRLEVRGTSAAALRLVPGDSGEVPVSVRLDCTRAATTGDGLRGTVAIPLNARQHTVSVTVDGAFLITDVADTLCRVKPDLKNAELSGPILPG
jgi:hypothetical protein